MKVLVKKCFKITGRGFVVEIQHSENGLPKGLKLLSENGQIWEIKSRVIFSHVENHNFFSIETQSPILIKFTDLEKRKESIDKILAKEKLNIFQYMIHNPTSTDSELNEEDLLQILEDFV